MSKQEELVENVCEQVRSCFAYINLFSTAEEYAGREYHLLKLESRHFDLLLELLESKITIASYVKEHNLLFSNEKFYDDPYAYPSLTFLEKVEKDIDTASVAEEVRCFINILRVCNENIKKHIVSESYDKIYNEIYYNHNVPTLIFSRMKVLIENYLLNECADCKKYCPKEMVSTYEEAWKEASNQFLSNIDIFV